jgi:hypothetical protein
MIRIAPTRLAALGACASALLLGACAQILGIDDLSGPDAGPASFTVSGVAAGLLQPVSIRLEHPGGSEPLRIEADGPFAFDTVLARGDSYEVVFEDTPPCVLWNASGTLSTEAPAIELACEPVLLSRLLMEGPGAPALDFEPGRSRYDVAVSALRQSVRITAATVSAEATLTVAGVPLASGATSEPLSLDFGDNPIEIQVSHPGGVERTYQLTLRRGAPPTQDVYAKASNSGAGDQLGYTMAMSGDTLVVGAPYEDGSATTVNGNPDDGRPDSGAAYVFRRTGDIWAQEAYLKASDSAASDNFGQRVAISGDVIAIGAPYRDQDAAVIDSGAVYIFRRGNDGAWTQEATLSASNAGAGDYFGWGIAVQGDIVAVGARAEDSSATGVGGNQSDEGTSDSGAVYVFRNQAGVWTQEAYIKASNTGREDNFGRDVALSGDTLAVGTFYEDGSASGVNGNQEDDGAVNSGAVYVFRLSNGVWAQEAYIKASNPGYEDNFGLDLELEQDTLVVGAPYEDSGASGINGNQANEGSRGSGAVYVFRRTDTTWVQQAYIKASNTGVDDNFGWSVALAGDLLVASAIGESSAATDAGGDQSDNTAKNSGAVYIFGRSDGTWVQNSYLKASNTGVEDWFGYEVAFSEHTLAVTARYEDSSASGVGGSQDADSAGDSGALYLFY